MKTFSRAYHWFLVISVVLMFLSLLYGESRPDALQAGYSVLSDYTFALRSLALLLLLNWLFYSFSHRLLYSAILMKLHLILTVVLVIGIITALLWNLCMQPRRYYDYGNNISPASLLIVVLLLTQLIFVINLFLGILKRTNSNHD